MDKAEASAIAEKVRSFLCSQPSESKIATVAIAKKTGLRRDDVIMSLGFLAGDIDIQLFCKRTKITHVICSSE